MHRRLFADQKINAEVAPDSVWDELQRYHTKLQYCHRRTSCQANHLVAVSFGCARGRVASIVEFFGLPCTNVCSSLDRGVTSVNAKKADTPHRDSQSRDSANADFCYIFNATYGPATGGKQLFSLRTRQRAQSTNVSFRRSGSEEGRALVSECKLVEDWCGRGPREVHGGTH